MEKTEDYQPHIDLPKGVYPDAFDGVTGEEGQEKSTAIKVAHDDLLEYLTSRIKKDENIESRRKRYASLDKLISTWQKLSVEDSKRKAKQEADGKPQAIATNLPVVHTHVDELTAFMSDVYAPNLGSYFATPNLDNKEVLKQLTERMNEDASASGFYTQLTLAVRSLLKYNIGGFHLDFIIEDVQNDSQSMEDGINWATALDMYNTFWDPSIANPTKVRLEAEWFAMAEVVNRMHLIRREQAGIYAGCSDAIHTELGGSFESKGSFYKYPPITAGIEAQDTVTGSGMSVNWEEYGKGLGTSSTDIQSGFELVTMYCWLNPSDFDLSFTGETGELKYAEDGYFLWKFKILAGQKIIFAEPVNQKSAAVADQGKTVIPAYFGYLNLDDMLGANRSVAELLMGFQTFASFLMNAHVEGARNSIWGIKTYDASMFDITALENSGGTAAYLASMQPGRDVRTGLNELKGTFDGSKTMGQVGEVMQLMQSLFPAQALPSQVAGMDRAIESQVAALMQGVTRRLQMMVRLADQSIFAPFRFDQFRNLVDKGGMSLEGLTDKQVRKALGSGIESMNREIAEGAIRQVLFTMIQNPTVVEQYDVNQMIELWGSLLKTPIDVSKLRLQKQQQPPPTQTTPTEAAPGPANIGMPQPGPIT